MSLSFASLSPWFTKALPLTDLPQRTRLWINSLASTTVHSWCNEDKTNWSFPKLVQAVAHHKWWWYKWQEFYISTCHYNLVPSSARARRLSCQDEITSRGINIYHSIHLVRTAFYKHIEGSSRPLHNTKWNQSSEFSSKESRWRRRVCQSKQESCVVIEWCFGQLWWRRLWWRHGRGTRSREKEYEEE